MRASDENLPLTEDPASVLDVETERMWKVRMQGWPPSLNGNRSRGSSISYSMQSAYISLIISGISICRAGIRLIVKPVSLLLAITTKRKEYP